MLMQSRYALALGTAALHLMGSLALTVAGIWSFQAWVVRA
jgi:CrcB protein